MEENGNFDDEVDVAYNLRQQKLITEEEFLERIANAISNANELDASEVESVPFDVENNGDEEYGPAEGSDAENEINVEINAFEIDEDDNDNDEEIIDQGNVVRSEDTFQQEANIVFHAKDGTKWSKEDPPSGRVRAHNILRQVSCGPADKNSTPIEVFRKFLQTKCVLLYCVKLIAKQNLYMKSSTAKTQQKVKKSGRMLQLLN